MDTKDTVSNTLPSPRISQRQRKPSVSTAADSARVMQSREKRSFIARIDPSYVRWERAELSNGCGNLVWGP